MANEEENLTVENKLEEVKKQLENGTLSPDEALKELVEMSGNAEANSPAVRDLISQIKTKVEEIKKQILKMMPWHKQKICLTNNRMTQKQMKFLIKNLALIKCLKNNLKPTTVLLTA